MLFIAVLVSVLSVTSACRCTPSKWEGKEGFSIGTDTGGTPTLTKGLASYSYDGTKEKIAAVEDIYVSGRAPQHVKVIQDFKEGKQYTIMTVEGKEKCMVTPSGPWTPPCVPGNATWMGDSYYGAGDDILNTTSFTFNLKGMDHYQTMTKKQCIPVAESITGNAKGTAFMVGAGFQGVTIGIKDPSVFDVPAICSKVRPIPNISPPIGVFRLRRSVY